MGKQKYIELIDKYLVKQSTDTEYNPPSYEWVDNIGEIIRCDDCIYYDETCLSCDEFADSRVMVWATDYCSHGERKDE